MEWIYTHWLAPLLELLYIPCDWLLGWSSRFPPIVSISIVGVISGVAVILVQKYGSNQLFLGMAKADLAFLKGRMKEAKAAKDSGALARARGLSGRIGGKYMWAALKPSLWTVPLIGLVGLWTGSRLGFLPIRPGDEFSVTAHFEDNAQGFAHVLPSDSLRPAGPLIAPVEIPQEGGAAGKQAHWKLRAETPGAALLVVRYAGQSYPIPIPIAGRGGRPPEPVTSLNDPSPAQDRLAAVEIKLAPSLPEAWWNLKLQWGGLYLLTAVGVALALRFLLKVH